VVRFARLFELHLLAPLDRIGINYHTRSQLAIKKTVPKGERKRLISQASRAWGLRRASLKNPCIARRSIYDDGIYLMENLLISGSMNGMAMDQQNLL
jgi:hypothetical protein